MTGFDLNLDVLFLFLMPLDDNLTPKAFENRCCSSHAFETFG